MKDVEIFFTGDCGLIIKNGKAYIKAMKYTGRTIDLSDEEIQNIITNSTEISIKTASAIMNKNDI